ncbi:hypothetical protein TRFO_36112 [Tritrichomonas foetus]|uniref:BEACH domain-containing protein n=1 Tax=Tritrichomonas foetus TaxID=1144522 RepID=A0A1J4JK75_9EUKA|nr:hypothetical protein TRFO_36112 [Tritrichomonas foetus]|eukprot:OHS97660.1 hypothetical protein TRFO_36112 [Tritrichomonas foetus]
MSKFSFLDFHSESHPLITIFTMRNSIFSGLKETDSEMNLIVLSFIPQLDKNTISSMSTSLKSSTNLAELFKKYKLPSRFDPNMINHFYAAISLHKSKSHKSKQYNDTNSKDRNIAWEPIIISVVFAAIVLFIDKDFRSQNEFNDFFHFFSILINKKNKINNLINYGFKMIVEAMSASNNFEWNDKLFSSIFQFILLNKSLDEKMYKTLLEIFRIAFEKGSQEIISQLMKLISQIIIEKRKCIIWNEISYLVILFTPQINLLGKDVLLLISLISNYSNSSSISDIFILLPSILLNTLDFDEDDHLSFPNKLPIPDIAIQDLPYTFSRSNLFENGFKGPDLNPFDLSIDSRSVLNEKTINGVDIISECLTESSYFCREQFFHSYGKMFHILKETNRYIQTCTVFVLLMEKMINYLPIEIFLSILNDTILFAPEHNIYSKHGLDRMINYLRNRVFILVGDSSPSSLSLFFEKADGYPFLFTEHLMRILARPWLIESISNNKNALLIIQTTLKLRFIETNQLNFSNSSENYDIKRARNDNFLFVFQYCKDPQLFQYDNFSRGFFWFIFEDNLTEYIIFFLQVTITNLSTNYEISSLVNIIDRIYHQIVLFYKDKNFQRLSILLTAALSESLVQNIHILPYFEKILPLILETLEIFPCKESLDSCFRIIESWNQMDKDKMFDSNHFRILSTVIKIIEPNNLSTSTYRHLFNLLSLSSNTTDFSHFHIKKPSALSLLLSVFSQYEKSIEFIQYLSSLCDYSEFNIRACHDGDIDLILLDFINSKKETTEIKYRGVSFILHFTYEEIKDLILPFLLRIFVYKSNNGICEKLASIIGQKIDRISILVCSCLSDVISKIQSLPKPKFSIGTFSPNVSFRNVPSKMFSTTFVIKYDINFDAVTILISNTSLHIFSVVDKENDIKLRILTDHMSLYLYTSYKNTEKLVLLIRVLPSSGWNHYSIKFEPFINGYHVQTFMNGSHVNSVDAITSHFKSNKVYVSIGGFSKLSSNDWLNVELGVVSHFSISSQNSNLPDENANISMKSQVLIERCRTDNLTHFNRFHIFTEEDEIKTIIEGNIENSHNLMFYLVKGDFVNNLCNYLFTQFTDNYQKDYIKLIFDVLVQIMPLNKKVQHLKNIEDISHYLSSNIHILDSDLFFCVYRIFEKITTKNGDQFSIKWFELLILDFWLWSRTKPSEFKRILNFFVRQIVFSQAFYFCRSSYFAMLLNQYYLMFCMKDDCITHEYQIDDFTIFDHKEYSIIDIEECRVLFEMLLTRVATLKMEKNGADTLFSHLFSSESSKTISTMLHLLVEVSPEVLRSSENFKRNLDFLHKFIKGNINNLNYDPNSDQNIDIVVQTILIIHQLAGEDIHHQLLTISFELNCDMYKLFVILSTFVQKYPNLYILLSILALQLHEIKKNQKSIIDEIRKLLCSILLLICENYEIKSLFQYCQFWYLWPCLLVFNGNDRQKQKICHFLSKMLLEAPNKISDIDHIVDIFDLITSVCGCCTAMNDSNDISFLLLKELCEENLYNELSIQKHSILRCFYSIFMHFTNQPNRNSFVTSQIIKSLMYQIDSNNYSKDHTDDDQIGAQKELMVNSFKSPKEFEYFISDKFTEFQMKYQIRLDKEGNWVDKAKAQFIVNTFKNINQPDPKLETIFYIVLYFLDKDSYSFEKKIQIQTSFEMIFAPLMLAYDKQFKSNIYSFAADLKELMDKSSHLVTGNRQALCNLVDIDSRKLLSEEIIRATLQCDIQVIPPPKLKRSLISAPDFCPHSMKYSQIFKKVNLYVNLLKFNSKNLINNNLIANSNDSNAYINYYNEAFNGRRSPNKSYPILELKCVRVKYDSTKVFIFRLFNDCFCLSESKHIQLDDILMIFNRKRNNNDTAIEIFTVDGRSFFLDFIVIDHSVLIRSFLDVKMPNLKFIPKTFSTDQAILYELTNKWEQGFISNFDYLMYLNSFAGRTFNEKSSYPIFPSILADYQNCSIVRDINQHFKFNSANFRSKNLRESIIGPSLIPPEYFYFCRMIGKNDILPCWANSSIDFIYKHRVLLESKALNESLAKWIDNIFGTKIKSQYGHTQLFFTKHPIRKNRLIHHIDNQQNFAMKNIEIKKSVTKTCGPLKFNIVFLLKDGSLISTQITTSEFVNPIVSIEESKKLIGNVSISSIDENLSIFERDKRKVHFNRHEYYLTADTDFYFAFTSGATYCPDDTTIANVKFGYDPDIIWRTSAKICTIDVSWRFKIVAFATVDGFVRIGSVRNGNEINKIYILDEVKSIKITKNFGFVVFAYDQKVTVLSIDGDFIKEVKIKDRIMKLFPIDRRGIDMIAFMNDKCEIKLFEAFYPDKIVNLCLCECEVMCLEYDAATDAFIVARKNGKVSLVSYPN